MVLAQQLLQWHIPCSFFHFWFCYHSILLSWRGSFKNGSSLAYFQSVHFFFGGWGEREDCAYSCSSAKFLKFKPLSPFASLSVSCSATRCNSCQLLTFHSFRRKTSSNLCISSLNPLQDFSYCLLSSSRTQAYQLLHSANIQSVDELFLSEAPRYLSELSHSHPLAWRAPLYSLKIALYFY